MLELSNTTNLLEDNTYRYSLQDVAEPNLYRDMYSYDTVPKVAFNHRRVPMGMPAEIWITDTSLRDGQQSVEPYSVEQIVQLFKLMSKLGGPYGIIRQTEMFVYSKKDREALLKCQDLGLTFPEITTWIRANREDFKLVKDLGIRETGILVSCSDYHIFKKLKMTRKQAMDQYLAAVSDAFEAGVMPRCHLEDITRADFYGFVVPFVNALMDMSRQAGIPVRIRACDTMGYGVPYSEVSLPRSVPGIIYGLQHFSQVPSEMLEWHGHNDFYKGVANAATAWLYGASGVTAPCWVSVSAPATYRWRPWLWSMHLCVARWTAWIPPLLPRSPSFSSGRSATSYLREHPLWDVTSTSPVPVFTPMACLRMRRSTTSLIPSVFSTARLRCLFPRPPVWPVSPTGSMRITA